MHGIQLIFSDDNTGVETAYKAVFTGIPWQRCQFHLLQITRQYLPRVDIRREVAEEIPVLAADASIPTFFNTPDQATKETYLKKVVEKYVFIAFKLADWMEVNIPEWFAVFSFPRCHQRRLRTSNYLKRLSQELVAHPGGAGISQ